MTHPRPLVVGPTLLLVRRSTVGPNVVGADCRRFRRGSGVLCYGCRACRIRNQTKPNETLLLSLPLSHGLFPGLGGFVGVATRPSAIEFGTVPSLCDFYNPTDELVAVYALESAPMVGVSTSFYQILWWGVGPKRQPFVVRGVSQWPTTAGSWLRGCRPPATRSKSAWTRTSRRLRQVWLHHRHVHWWVLVLDPGQSADAVAGGDNRSGRTVHHNGGEHDLELQWDDAASNTSSRATAGVPGGACPRMH